MNIEVLTTGQLLAVLRSTDPAFSIARERAVTELAGRDIRRAVPALTTMLMRANSSETAFDVARVLALHGEFETLIGAIARGANEYPISQVYGCIPPEQSGPALIAALAHPDAAMQASAAYLLLSVQCPASVEPLCALLVTTRNHNLHTHVMHALANQHDARAVPHLVPFLTTPQNSHRHTAAYALQAFDAPALEAHVLPLMTHEGPTTRENALLALSGVRTRSVLRAAKRALLDDCWDVQKVAADYVRTYGTDEARQAFFSWELRNKRRKEAYRGGW